MTDTRNETRDNVVFALYIVAAGLLSVLADYMSEIL